MLRLALVAGKLAEFRKFATRILTSWGHTVIGETGSVAGTQAKEAILRPDTVLVDIGLPDGGGSSLTEQLAAMPWAVWACLSPARQTRPACRPLSAQARTAFRRRPSCQASHCAS